MTTPEEEPRVLLSLGFYRDESDDSQRILRVSFPERTLAALPGEQRKKVGEAIARLMTRVAGTDEARRGYPETIEQDVQTVLAVEGASFSVMGEGGTSQVMTNLGPELFAVEEIKPEV